VSSASNKRELSPLAPKVDERIGHFFLTYRCGWSVTGVEPRRVWQGVDLLTDASGQL